MAKGFKRRVDIDVNDTNSLDSECYSIGKLVDVGVPIRHSKVVLLNIKRQLQT